MLIPALITLISLYMVSCKMHVFFFISLIDVPIKWMPGPSPNWHHPLHATVHIVDTLVLLVKYLLYHNKLQVCLIRKVSNRPL